MSFEYGLDADLFLMMSEVLSSRQHIVLEDKTSDIIKKICIQPILKRHVGLKYFC